MRSLRFAPALALLLGCTHAYEDYFATHHPERRPEDGCPGGGAVPDRTIQPWSKSSQYACFIHAARPEERRDPRAPGDVSTANENAKTLEVVYGDEAKIITSVKSNDYSRYVGLALSGGGVRSASFGTGVMRGLHDLGILEKTGYLSTVSGGGFAAAWMMSFHDVGDEAFAPCDPASPIDMRPEYVVEGGRRRPRYALRPPLDTLFRPGSNYRYHLTQHGEYLGYQHGHNSQSQLVLTIGKSLFAFPFNFVFNDLLGYDVNTGPFRRLYRDGIDGAFLFNYTSPGRDDTVPLRALPMSCFGPSDERPFWIVNMTLSLIDDHGAHHGRVGDAFELTPLWGGGTSVGYVATPRRWTEDRYREVTMAEPGRTEFLPWSPTAPRPPAPMRGADVYGLDRDNFWMSPSYAVAISGAALDGHSLENGTIGDALLDFYGAGVGYFVNGWSPRWWPESRFTLEGVGERGLFYLPLPLVYPLVASHTRSSDGARYLLLDGGVFDNTGLYALVRRGVRFIVVSDGTQDPVNAVCKRSYDADHPWRIDTAALGQSFSDLRNTEILLRTDLGVSIKWQWEDLCPTFKSGELLEHPHAYVMRGTIEGLPVDKSGSGRRDTVHIVYVKAAYVAEGQALEQNGFIDVTKANDPDFANDPTTNQFFSEARVASYDELGYQQIGPRTEGLCRLATSWRAFCKENNDGDVDDVTTAAGKCGKLEFVDVARCEHEAPPPRGAPRAK
jgi:hypothetical protein